MSGWRLCLPTFIPKFSWSTYLSTVTVHWRLPSLLDFGLGLSYCCSQNFPPCSSSFPGIVLIDAQAERGCCAPQRWGGEPHSHLHIAIIKEPNCSCIDTRSEFYREDRVVSGESKAKNFSYIFVVSHFFIYIVFLWPGLEILPLKRLLFEHVSATPYFCTRAVICTRNTNKRLHQKCKSVHRHRRPCSRKCL